MTPAKTVRRGARLGAVAAVTALAATALVSCASGRSLEAYCSTIAEHKDRYLSAMEEVNSTDNLIAGLAGMVSALGDLSQMWEEAEKVAPEDIQPDVADVAELWKSQFEAAEEIMSDPIKGLTSSLMNGFENAGALQRVDEYTAENCPDVGAMFFDSGAASSGEDEEEDDGDTATSASKSPSPSPTATGVADYEALDNGSWSVYGEVLRARGDRSYVSPQAGFVMPEIVDLIDDEKAGEPDLIYISGDDPLRVAVHQRIRVPSDGFTPEKFVDKIFDVESTASGSRILAEWTLQEVPERNEAVAEIVGSSENGVVVVQISPSEDEDRSLLHVKGYDLATGDPVWSRDASSARADDEGRVLLARTLDSEVCGGSDATEFAVVDVDTGDDVWNATGSADDGDRHTANCVVVDPEQSIAHYARFEAYDASGALTTTLTDLSTGETRSYPSLYFLEDPVGDVIGVFRNSDEGDSLSIRFVDVATEEDLFLLEGKSIDDLDMDALRLYDGLLYVITTDEQLVVDVRSGETVGKWTVRPLAEVGGYIWLSDNTLVRNWSYQGA